MIMFNLYNWSAENSDKGEAGDQTEFQMKATNKALPSHHVGSKTQDKYMLYTLTVTDTIEFLSDQIDSRVEIVEKQKTITS